MKKETLKAVKAVARKLQPVPPPKTHKDKKQYRRHEKHRVAFRNESGPFYLSGGGDGVHSHGATGVTGARGPGSGRARIAVSEYGTCRIREHESL